MPVKPKNNKQTILFAFVLLFVIYSISGQADTILQIERERAVLREGPGSFYDIIAELSRGQEVNHLSTQDGWFFVGFNHTRGYLSPRMTERGIVREGPFDNMSFIETSTEVSQHAMAAGVKGFGERWTQTFKGDPGFLELALTYEMNAELYKIFKRDTHKNINIQRIRRRIPIPPKNVPDYYSMQDEGLGLGIASRIASLGIYNDPFLQEYINQVGNLIVEGSDVFDNTFKFFVLDIPYPNAYSTPGGIVFITRGMLRLLETEAELALVLAHEIAHIARFHGMLEMEQRKHHIAADDAFAEMDRVFEEILPGAVDQETRSLIDDLDQLAFNIFEKIINGRLDKYEEEADHLSMIYSMRAGYAPHGLLALLKRLSASNIRSNNEHYSYDGLKKRAISIERRLRSMHVPDGLSVQRERYQNYKKRL